MAEAGTIDEIEKLVRDSEDPKAQQSKATKNFVCKAFLHNNTCKSGNNCQFSHDIKRIRICEHFKKGNCNKGDNCDFRHDVTPCKFFDDGGFCKNGADCQYKHIQNICKNYNKGFCCMGDKCRNYHEFKKPCMNYLTGFCPNGPNCKQFHPKQFYHMDQAFLEHWKTLYRPNLKMIVCNKCSELGHKANKCTLEISFETKASKKEQADYPSYNDHKYPPPLPSSSNLPNKKLKTN